MKTFFTTTRITGFMYLGLAITGMVAFLFARQKLYVPEDAMTTATNFFVQEGLARIGIAAELALVAFQALTAVWFFKLFRNVNSFAAGSLATFGSINAVLILIGTAAWLSSFMTATSTGVTPTPDQANSAYMLFNLHETTWMVGKLFFGLWLIPMGYLVGAAKMPKLLSWSLIAGGLGYFISLFLQILAPGISTGIIESLTIPADIGEFWIIGYLLFKRVKI